MVSGKVTGLSRKVLLEGPGALIGVLASLRKWFGPRSDAFGSSWGVLDAFWLHFLYFAVLVSH